MNWVGWIEHHASLHVWRGDEDLRTLDLWARDFERQLYAPDEMARASEALLRHPPRFRSDHYRALRAAADAARRQAGAGAAPRRDCRQCGGLGAVALPTGEGPSGLRDYWCDCVPEGDPRREGHPARLNFRDYRATWPGWRERVREWAERLAEREPLLARVARAKAEALTGEGQG
jgi:hypothetical protein